VAISVKALGKQRHSVLSVGYQAKGAPWQIVQQYGPEGGYVELDGERIDIQPARPLGGHSAHIDRRGLHSFVTRMCHWPCEVSLVHCEASAKRQLTSALEARYAGRQLSPIVTL